MDFDTFITTLRSVPSDDKLQILELLACIAEDGMLPIIDLTDNKGICPTNAQTTQITACLLEKGYESTLSESRRTNTPYNHVERTYKNTDYQIRHALSSLQLTCRVPSMFHAMAQRITAKQNYTPRHGAWD